MKMLFAPDSFKGTLSSREIIAIMEEESRKIFPGCEAVRVPMADGGEGTESTLVEITGGKHIPCTVRGPLNEPVEAGFGVLNGDTAVVEMAAASGLPLVPEKKRDPRNTTSYGTGELMAQALKQGYRKLIVAVGGSATNDGGMGCMAALGVCFKDAEGKVLEGRGGNLAKVAQIDLSGLMPEIKETEIIVMCDVQNPLLGKTGSTYIYGPQKGAVGPILEELENGMTNYEAVVYKTLGIRLGDMPGAGAAGGISAALYAFCGAKLQSGIKTILELIHFEEMIRTVDLVVTGEGRLDGQSAFGKVLCGVGEACKRQNVPAIAIVGCMGDGAENIFDHGICSAMTTVSGFLPTAEAFARSEEFLRSAANRAFRLVKVGADMAAK